MNKKINVFDLNEIYQHLNEKFDTIHEISRKKAQNVDVEVGQHLITADPLRDMNFIINQINADLVVIHAHGNNNNRFVSFEDNNVSDTQIGSVSERLLRTSDVPILLIK